MFQQIQSFFSKLWQNIQSFFTKLFIRPVDFTVEDKFAFVNYLLKGQSRTGSGFGLRHVDSDEIKNANIRNGFHGDAISFSVTTHIMGLALGEDIQSCAWNLPESGEIRFITNNANQLRVLDHQLAARIFDCLHDNILKFIGLNFSRDVHHFMFIKNMVGACYPYDIKEIYPTGKCGKQPVAGSQIVKVFSKNAQLSSKEKMVHGIEMGVLQMTKKAKHEYSPESTTAILSVLREIKLKPDESLLTEENVGLRLAEAEGHGSDDRIYRLFHDRNGNRYLDKFKQSITKVNDDLEYFRGLIS